MTTQTENGSPPSLTGWQARAIHTITVPSGQTVKIRVPGVATLMENDLLPSDLLEVALAEVTRPTGAPGWVTEPESPEGQRDRLVKYARLQRHLVAVALVDPVLSYDEITDAVHSGVLPEDDLVMVAEIAMRLTDRDALGVRLGVDPIERWATFRRFHECPEGCPACEAVVESFSTVAAGGV